MMFIQVTPFTGEVVVISCLVDYLETNDKQEAIVCRNWKVNILKSKLSSCHVFFCEKGRLK